VVSVVVSIGAVCALLNPIITFVEKIQNAASGVWRWYKQRRAPAEPVHPAQSSPTPSVSVPVKELDSPPKIYTLHPRLCGLGHNGDKFTENGSLSDRGVIATFRMAKPPANKLYAHITARISYRTTQRDIMIRETSKEIHRVNYGTWLDEDYNFVEVQDNRHSLSKYNPSTFFDFPQDLKDIYADVTLVHDEYGILISYTYQIVMNPLAVHEIIRV
jgi:hypothetical protein